MFLSKNRAIWNHQWVFVISNGITFTCRNSLKNVTWTRSNHQYPLINSALWKSSTKIRRAAEFWGDVSSKLHWREKLMRLEELLGLSTMAKWLNQNGNRKSFNHQTSYISLGLDTQAPRFSHIKTEKYNCNKHYNQILKTDFRNLIAVTSAKKCNSFHITFMCIKQKRNIPNRIEKFCSEGSILINNHIK